MASLPPGNGFQHAVYSGKSRFLPPRRWEHPGYSPPCRVACSLSSSSERGALLRIQGISAVANLEDEIALRQKHQALRRLEPLCRDTKIKTLHLPSLGKGTLILLLAVFEQGSACYTALGEKGKPAEKVADEACDSLQLLLNRRAGIDEYLADQLLLPLALAHGSSKFASPRITGHLLTNAQVIRKFLPVEITIEGELDQEGWITIHPEV